MSRDFKPHHINATSEHFEGNDGIGRYIIIPGSDGRAQTIAEQFDNVTHHLHPRGHNLYLGTISNGKHSIDVATISSGMGCPSMEIILHELYHLGAKRFLRVGTAGSLQPKLVPVGDLVNVQASVRDEDTSTGYMPLEVPAIASIEMINAISQAAKNCSLAKKVHTGTIHCKSSLYAREFGAGPRAAENEAYLRLLTDAGILASEMETAGLFIQCQLYNYNEMMKHKTARHRVLAGAILAIITTPPYDFNKHAEKANIATEESISLALETIKVLASEEIGV